MDPNATLTKILGAVALLRAAVEEGVPVDTDRLVTLCDNVEALNEWLTKGGFTPTGWTS